MPFDPSVIGPSSQLLSALANPKPITNPLDVAAQRQKLLAGQLDIEKAQREAAGEQATNEALQSPDLITQDKDGNPAFNLQGIQKVLSAKNAGHLFPSVADKLTTIQDHYSEIKKRNADAAKANQAVDDSQKLAYGTQGIFVQDADYDPGAYNLMLDYGKAHGQLTDDQVASMKAQVAAAPDPKAFIKIQVDQALADPGVKKVLQAQQRINIKQQQADTQQTVGAATVAGKEEKTLQDAKANVAQELQAAFKQGPEAYQRRLNEIKADTTNKTWAIAARSMPLNPTSVQDIRRGGGLTEAQQEQAAQADVKAQQYSDRLAMMRQSVAERATARATKQATEPGGSGLPGGMTPEALENFARSYATTNQLPSLGWGKEGGAIRIAIANRAAELRPGANLAANGSLYKAESQNLNNLRKIQGNADAFSDKFDADLGVLTQELGKIPDTGSPILNRGARSWAREVLGDENMPGFEVARQAAYKEFTKIVTTANLGGSPPGEKTMAEVSALIDPNATVGMIKNAIRVMKKETANRHAAYDKAIQNSVARIDNILTGPSGTQGTAPTTPGTVGPTVAPAAVPAGGTRKPLGDIFGK